MTDKSDLAYLLEALYDAMDHNASTYSSLVMIKHGIRRAIERRKQDLAQRNQLWDAKEVMQDAGKSNPTGNAQPGAAHPADNTPKGGGDVNRFNAIPVGRMAHDMLCCISASDYDALLAERDAARAELREALDLLRKNVQLGMTPLICAPTLHDDVSNFLDRVGKQP